MTAADTGAFVSLPLPVLRAAAFAVIDKTLSKMQTSKKQRIGTSFLCESRHQVASVACKDTWMNFFNISNLIFISLYKKMFEYTIKLFDMFAFVMITVGEKWSVVAVGLSWDAQHVAC